MKKFRFIPIVVFLISGSFLSPPTGAQEKTKEEKEMELRMQEEIDQQKKAIADQKKAQEEVSKAMEDQGKVVDEALKQAQEQVETAPRYKDMVKIYRGNRDIPRHFDFNEEPFVITPGLEPFYGHPFGRDNERTTWDFTKSIKENSFSTDYTFEVEPTVNTMLMSVNGDCKAGDIRIRIIMPDGKEFER